MSETAIVRTALGRAAPVLFSCVYFLGCGSDQSGAASSCAPCAAQQWQYRPIPASSADCASPSAGVASTGAAPTATAPAAVAPKAAATPEDAALENTENPSGAPPPAELPGAVLAPQAHELEAAANGPATGGPRGTRRCEFRESVDTYARRCVVTKNTDGSLQITAKGTELNPANGFEFSLHGGPYEYVAKGVLNAFEFCAGQFVARAIPIIDNGVTTYELQLNKHCKIVIR